MQFPECSQALHWAGASVHWVSFSDDGITLNKGLDSDESSRIWGPVNLGGKVPLGRGLFSHQRYRGVCQREAETRLPRQGQNAGSEGTESECQSLSVSPRQDGGPGRSQEPSCEGHTCWFPWSLWLRNLAPSKFAWPVVSPFVK